MPVSVGNKLLSDDKTTVRVEGPKWAAYATALLSECCNPIDKLKMTNSKDPPNPEAIMLMERHPLQTESALFGEEFLHMEGKTEENAIASFFQKLKLKKCVFPICWFVVLCLTGGTHVKQEEVRNTTSVNASCKYEELCFWGRNNTEYYWIYPNVFYIFIHSSAAHFYINIVPIRNSL
ncbi:hypothetical protein L596_021600 [Steinernema carpocapsae]|uniref:Uncharacterized protein n=1 Tax=Steinernema carpocapsae TaxID=34508 RepID=A0A4U5MJ89_STECR|nr:hypothetical protein L596_021600 [Steinernema carpocapsae]